MIQPSHPEPTDLCEETTAPASHRKITTTGEKSRIKEFGLQAPTNKVKNYVLDTNVLLHDPGCLNQFEDNHICIPVDVLAELDKFKSEQSERGANARQVHRRLTELFSSGERVTSGVPTDGGGTIRLVIYDPDFCEQNSKELSQFLRGISRQGAC